MKWSIAIAAACLLTVPVVALDGQPRLHDPSTVIAQNGKYYVYATGRGLPVSISDDGWTWRRAGGVMQAVSGGKPGPDVIARGGNNTWAPDVIRVGEKYFLYYAAPGTQPKAAIGLLVGKTLDPDSPDYTWEDAGPVVWSDGVEDSNAIETVVNSPRELRDVRLAIGSNAASVWWVNDKEATALYNDGQTVIDDGVSKRLTLNQGANVIRAAIVNAGGATDFCARFLDENDRPIKTLTTTLPRQ